MKIKRDISQKYEFVPYGGREGIRTPDPLGVNQVL